jgi:hypothetical protein
MLINSRGLFSDNPTAANIALPVQEQKSGGDRRFERSSPPWISLPGVAEKLRRIAQSPSDIHTDVGRLGEPSAAIRSPRARIGSPEQCRHRADGVAPAQRTPAGGLEQGGDMLVRIDGGIGQMPGLPLGLIYHRGRQSAVRLTTFALSGQLDHR